MTTLRLATRRSAQARTQAAAVAHRLEQTVPSLHTELVEVDTTGDRRTNVPLHEIGGQGVFVKEVQRAVVEGRADATVHSAKDLPSELIDGLVIGAIPPRRDPRDALVGRSLDELGHGATVATGSVRRRAQLAHARPDLVFVELRGNIHTRLDRVPPDGAIVMAVAALEILDLTDRIAEIMDTSTMVPMVGQGALAIECRPEDDRVLEMLGTVDDPSSHSAVEVERAFLGALGAGCSHPVGAYCHSGILQTFLAHGTSPGDRLVSDRIDLSDGDPLALAAAAAHRARQTLEAVSGTG